MNGVASVFYRDYRQRTTNLAFVFWDLFVPVAYLILFGLGFERTMGRFSVHGVEVGYAEFFLAGVLGMTTYGIAMNASWGLFMDKDSGIFYELLTYPITRRQLLVGKICFNVLLSALGSLFAITLAALVMDVTVRWSWVPLTLFVVACTTAGWFFLFSILAIRLARMDAFNTMTSVAYIILMFLSSMFYPLEQLPVWFRVVAWMNPMTWQVDVLRFTLLGAGSATLAFLEFGGFLLFTVLCLSLAVRTINRAG
jgi:ABC-2 type transport system permease protein